MRFLGYFSPRSFFNYSLHRLLRKMFGFIKYDFVEFLVIVACAALLVLIWDYFF